MTVRRVDGTASSNFWALSMCVGEACTVPIYHQRDRLTAQLSGLGNNVGRGIAGNNYSAAEAEDSP